MATKVRKKSNGRRRVTNRRRAHVKQNPRHSSFRASRRVRRVNRRRRNPQIKTLLSTALYAGAGAMAYGAASSFIPIQASGLVGLGINFGIAYVVSMVGEKVLPANAHTAFTAGVVGGVGRDIINYVLGIVRGPLTGILSPGAMQVGGGEAVPQLPPGAMGMHDIVEDGMGDIVAADDLYA